MGTRIELRTWNVLAREIPAAHMWVCWQQQHEAGRSSLCPQVYDTGSAHCRIWLAGGISSHWTWGYRELNLLWFWLLSHRICNEFSDPDSGFVFRGFFNLFFCWFKNLHRQEWLWKGEYSVTKIWSLQYLFLEIKKVTLVSAGSVPLDQSMRLVAQN